jgi:acetyl esterase/lipase
MQKISGNQTPHGLLGLHLVLARGALLVAAWAFAPAADATPEPPTVELWRGAAPGSEHATQREVNSPSPSGKFLAVRNVVRPTLTIYRALPNGVAGAAVIIAPGGAFRFLNFDSEGTLVAEWLAAHGVNAFVLKYRVVETAADDATMWKNLGTEMANVQAAIASLEDDGKLGVADGIQALKVVRAHAKEWGVAEHRLGFLGFSAGAMIASRVMLAANPAERPDFVAPIYGAPFGEIGTLDTALPPAFFAYASDDQLVPHFVDVFYQALRAAGQHPELHIYDHGGHGFGMSRQGTTSDHWIEDYFNWLVAHGYAARPQ